MPARRSFTSQQKSKDRFLLLKSNRISKVNRLKIQLECIERNFRESKNKLEALSSRHQATTKALWRLEDALEKYEGQEEREAKLVDEIIGLKRQIVFANHQISKLKHENFILKNPRKLRSSPTNENSKNT